MKNIFTIIITVLLTTTSIVGAGKEVKIIKYYNQNVRYDVEYFEMEKCLEVSYLVSILREGIEPLDMEGSLQLSIEDPLPLVVSVNGTYTIGSKGVFTFLFIIKRQNSVILAVVKSESPILKKGGAVKTVSGIQVLSEDEFISEYVEEKKYDIFYLE